MKKHNILILVISTLFSCQNSKTSNHQQEVKTDTIQKHIESKKPFIRAIRNPQDQTPVDLNYYPHLSDSSKIANKRLDDAIRLHLDTFKLNDIAKSYSVKELAPRLFLKLSNSGNKTLISVQMNVIERGIPNAQNFIVEEINQNIKITSEFPGIVLGYYDNGGTTYKDLVVSNYYPDTYGRESKGYSHFCYLFK